MGELIFAPLARWKPLDWFNLIGGVMGFIDLFLTLFAFVCFWVLVTKNCACCRRTPALAVQTV